MDEMAQIDTIYIKVQADTAKASENITGLAQALKSLSDSVASKADFGRLSSRLLKISAAVSGMKLSTAGVGTLQDLAIALANLKHVGEISFGKTGTNLERLGRSVDTLNNINFHGLATIKEGLKGLAEIGAVKIPTLQGMKRLSKAAEVATGAVKDTEAQHTTQSVEEVAEAVRHVHDEAVRARRPLAEVLAPLRNMAPIAGSVARQVGNFIARFTGLHAVSSMLSGITAKIQNLVTIFKKRVVYRLMNAMISAVTTGFREGMNNLYQFSLLIEGTFAKAMDSLATSALYLKNSLGAMVAPLIEQLAPAFDALTDKAVDFFNMVNQAFARLAGQSTWTKAIKYPVEYAEAADQAKKKTNELKATILAIDEINPLKDNSTRGSGSTDDLEDYSKMFEIVSLEADEVGSGFFNALDEGWNSIGRPVFEQLQNTFNHILSQLPSIKSSFADAFGGEWLSTALGTLTSIAGNIMLTWTNLIDRIVEAWNTSGIGDSIANSLATATQNFLDFIDKFNRANADFMANLDFAPVLSSIADLMEALNPLTDLIEDGLLWGYENVLLPLGKWVIEDVVPSSINTVTTAITKLTEVLNIFSDDTTDIFDKLNPIFEGFGAVVGGIIDGISLWIENLSKAFSDRSDEIKGALGRISEALGFLGGDTDNICGQIRTAIAGLIGYIARVFGLFAGFFIDTFTGMIEFLSGVFTLDVEKIFRGLANTVLSPAIKFVLDGINTLIDGINWLLGGLQIFGVDAQIPKIENTNFFKNWVNSLDMSGFGNSKTASDIQADIDAVKQNRSLYADLSGSAVTSSGYDGLDVEAIRASVEEMNVILGQIRDKRETVEVTANVTTGDIISGLNRSNRRNGATIIPVEA